MVISRVVNRVLKSRVNESVSDAYGEVNLDGLENGIHLDFENDFHYIKEAGKAAVVGSLTSFFTFTGGNQSRILDVNGLLTTTATNTPRIEFIGGRRGLLMEASRQNVILNNADLSQGTWTKADCSISTSPSVDGTTRSIRIVENGATAVHGVIAGVTVTANTTYCLSAIVTPQGRQFAYMYGTNTDQFGAIFDFVNRTATNIIAGTSTINQTGIRAIGNGRFLIWVSGVLNAASTILNFVGGPAISTAVPAGYTYAGDSVSGIDMEYIQIEAGSFPTSRILNAGSALTRTADSCIRTLGSEFSATAGTVVLAGRTSGGQDALGQTIIEFDDTTNAERHTITRAAAADSVRYNMFDGGVLQSSLDSATLGNGTAFKSAWAWALNDIAQSTNGGAVNTDTGATLPTVTQLVLGGPGGNGNSFMNGHILRFDYYPKRETDGFLQRAST